MNTAVQGVVSKIITAVVDPILTVLFALAVVYFIWGAASFIMNKDDAEKRNETKNHILYAVIGIFIMVTAYGIIRFVAGSLSGIGVTAPF